MINNEFYYLNEIKDTFSYTIHYITENEEYKVDRLMNTIYDRDYGKYFKIMLYLNEITYVNELIEGLIIKVYDMDSILNFMRINGFEI